MKKKKVKTEKRNDAELVSERDNKGRFVKGNSVRKGKKLPESVSKLKGVTREEIVFCAFSLTKSLGSINEDLENQEISRLEHLTLTAAKNHNHKFIQWLLEMTVGKPTQTIDSKIDETNRTFILKYKDPKED